MKLNIVGAGAGALLLVAAGLGGCASTSEIESVRAEAEAAKVAAQNAQQEAEAARAAAEAAAAEAAAASEKADRIYQQSLRKVK